MKLRSRWSVVLLSALIFALPTTGARAHTDITPATAHDMILADDAVIVLDVREYYEFCGSARHIEDAASMPWNSGVLSSRFSELPLGATIIVVCQSGGRSHPAANLLDGQGFSNVYDMLGGMNAWAWGREFCDAEPLLTVSRHAPAVEVDWTPVPGTQDYDLLRGQIENVADMTTYVDLGPTSCLSDDSVMTYLGDEDTVPPGSAYFYLARQKDGTWGEPEPPGRERLSASASCD